MGLKIRKERISGKPPTISIVKRHRRRGPIAAFLGITGFFAGVLIVYLNEGHILEYPLHFILGLSIVALIFTTFIVSKKIRAQDTTFRNPHFVLGIMIICLYCVQVFIGLKMLFNHSH